MDREKTFDKLPVEVISHLFLFLNFEDRKTLSVVCRSWYEASIHPMFLIKETICFKKMKDSEIQNALEVYTKSSRAFFSFKICGLGNLPGLSPNHDEDISVVNEYHWAVTVWPLLAKKVIYLEFFDTIDFVEDILPSMLNATEQLKVLKIQNLLYCSFTELYKVNKLQSLKELHLDNIDIDNIDKSKLLGIIPKGLRKICLKTMYCSDIIAEDIINVLSYCSSDLETLELIDIDVDYDLMQSIAFLDLKLKEFCLILAHPIHIDHMPPQILQPLFTTQWPLISLTLHAEFLTDEQLSESIHTFKNLEFLSMSNEYDLDIDEEVINSIRTMNKFNVLQTLPNKIILKKIK